MPLDGGDVERRGQEVDDSVEQRLDALVLERCAADDGGDRVRDARLAQRGLDLVDRDLLVLEELHHQLVVVLGGGLDELVPVHLGVVGELGRDLPMVGLMPLSSSLKKIAFISTRSMMPDELVLGADRAAEWAPDARSRRSFIIWTTL
jgi:hypothetical protein